MTYRSFGAPEPRPAPQRTPRRRWPARVDQRVAIAIGLGAVAILAGAVIGFSGVAAPSANRGGSPAPGSSAPGVGIGSPAAGSPAALGPSAVPTASASPAHPAGSAASFPLALVASNTDLRTGYTSRQVAALVTGGRVLVPCGLTAIDVNGQALAVPAASCTKADSMWSAVRRARGALGLLPPGLVDPRVKALTIDGADLFGDTVHRAKPYPLVGRSDALPAEMAGTAVAYDANDVRTVVSTGDTCPDRSVSLWAVVRGKGWDWTLRGGTARYTGIGVSHAFDGPTGNGWPVVFARRTGEEIGAVWRLIHDADIAVNDFECPLVTSFTQHDSGTFFTIDPRVAGLMKRVGMDVLSLASNHITDLGAFGVRETLRYLDAAGVKHAGLGLTLADAMKPAIVNVRGLRFAILSWDATGTSTVATAGRPGVMRPTSGGVRKALAAARRQADVVIVMPQWNWPEYSAPFSRVALAQRDLWYAAGADHILGSGTHWAGAMTVTEPDPAKGWRLAVTSHGNFLFGQDWSRQTEEGVIYEATFYGTRLVQVRIHPYVVMDGAQPNLTDPRTDGAYVQKQVYASSDLP